MTTKTISFFTNHPIENVCQRLLHGILGRPFSGRTIVSGLVRLQKLSNVRDKRIFGVGVGQKGANGKQHLTNGQCRTPLVLQNVQANATVGVDVTVVDTCGKVDLGGL